jgi:transcriptional regulator with XRE-family HTH domain
MLAPLTARVAYMGRNVFASRVLYGARICSMQGGPLIREARLRAGLTQAELAQRTGRERSVIARWEQGSVSPSIDNLLAVVHACGFELPLVLVARDTSQDESLEAGRLLSPERRVDRLLERVDGGG